MVWLRKKWTGAVLDTCTYLCVCVCLRLLSMSCRHHVCLIITPQSFLTSLSLALSLSVPLPSISLVPSLKLQYRTKHTVMQRECEAQQSGSSSHHNCIQLLPQCLLHPPLSSLPTLSAPKNILALFFYFLHNVSLSFSIYVLYICHTQFVSLLQQPIRALCRLLHPEALGLNAFFYAGKRKHFYSFNSSPRSSL